MASAASASYTSGNDMVADVPSVRQIVHVCVFPHCPRFSGGYDLVSRVRRATYRSISEKQDSEGKLHGAVMRLQYACGLSETPTTHRQAVWPLSGCRPRPELNRHFTAANGASCHLTTGPSCYGHRASPSVAVFSSSGIFPENSPNLYLASAFLCCLNEGIVSRTIQYVHPAFVAPRTLCI